MNGIKIPECWICRDEGFILYKDKDGYEFITHCICKAGTSWQYDGRKCQKRPSQYYIPSVAEKFDVYELARENLLNWWQIHKHKPGVKEELEVCGIQVEKLPRCGTAGLETPGEGCNV